ncbi:MAG: hypothetical protein WB783_18340 [Arenicellales bacterium]
MTAERSKVSIEGSDSPSSSARLLVEGPDALNECIERLFLACRGFLIVRAPRLDLDFYFSEVFTECCRSIIVRDLRNELRFLVEDEAHIMKANTRLVSLARQFSSYVKVRVAREEYVEHREMFVVCDSVAYLHQPNAEVPKAFMNTSDRAAARRLGLQFKDLWDRSASPEELFTMGL